MNIIVAHLHSPKKLQDLFAAIRIYVHVKPHKHHFWHSDLISLKLTSNAFHYIGLHYLLRTPQLHVVFALYSTKPQYHSRGVWGPPCVRVRCILLRNPIQISTRLSACWRSHMVTEPLFENADLLEQWNCEADALLLCGGSSVTGIRPLACCRPALESSIAHTMQVWYPQQREPISSPSSSHPGKKAVACLGRKLHVQRQSNPLIRLAGLGTLFA